MTSPYAFYQFWVNADDRGRRRATCAYFSFRSHEEIEELEQATAERPAARLAQRALAEELTTLVHGEAESRAGRRGVPGAVRPGLAGRPGAGDAARGAGRGRPGHGAPTLPTGGRAVQGAGPGRRA